MIRLQHERDVETLRQIGTLLDNENKRLVERNRKLTLELALFQVLHTPCRITYSGGERVPQHELLACAQCVL